MDAFGEDLRGTEDGRHATDQASGRWLGGAWPDREAAKDQDDGSGKSGWGTAGFSSLGELVWLTRLGCRKAWAYGVLRLWTRSEISSSLMLRPIWRSTGIALREARRSKERTYPELPWNGRVRKVVIAGEVGGRWSEETKAFLWSLACEKSRF